MNKLSRLSFLIVLFVALILVVSIVMPIAAQTTEPPLPLPPIVISTIVPPTHLLNLAESDDQGRKPFSGNAIFITDEQFVSGEPSDELEIQGKLEELNSPLASMNLEPVEGFSIPAASALAFLSEAYSVAPPVLLTLAEKELGILSNPAAITSTVELSEWLRNTAQQLSVGFYAAYYSDQVDVSSLARTGTGGGNPGSHALETQITLHSSSVLDSEMQNFRNDYVDDFTNIYTKYFGSPVRGQKRLEHPNETNAAAAQPQLWLPWTGGEVWNYNGGPHPFSAGGSPDQRLFSGVDFQPKGYAGLNCEPKYIAERWITASAAGKPIDYQTFWIKIDSDGDNKLTTGWQTVYGHVANRIGTSVTSVTRGQRLGNPSCYGGTATGVHVHFGLKYQNVWQVADGKVVSGWRIRNGQESYHGYMDKPSAPTRQSSYRPGGNYVWGQSELVSDNYPGSNTPTCNPGADQVALYIDEDYRGQCVVKNTGNYVNPGAIGLPNDSVSSIKVGSNVVLRLYEHDNYAGRSSSFSNNDSNLSNDTIGDNSVSSMKVERRTASCNPSADQVALYVDTDYRGQCVVKNLGSYVSPGAIGLPNDSISSVKVGSNVMLRLYEHDNYAGRASLFTGNDSNLGDNTIGNDSVSSMKVERRNSLNLALGRPSWASSVEASYATANKGNDGNTGTRWSSRHSSTNTNELWRVDLGSGAMFDKVKIRWETAYARRYFVGWSNDGNNLTGYWYSMSSAGYYGYTLGTRTARYAVVYMTEHAPCCGNYSFWEFEVVRTGALSEEGLRSGGESSEVILAVPESELVTIQLPMQMWIAP